MTCDLYIRNICVLDHGCLGTAVFQNIRSNYRVHLLYFTSWEACNRVIEIIKGAQSYCIKFLPILFEI